LDQLALVVDDSALIRSEIGRFLRKNGYRVITAGNGLEGLVRVAEMSPALIITGLMMPKLNGSEFIKEIRHRTHKHEITIVAIAGIRGRNVPSPKAGADHVIFKGVDIVEQLQLALGIGAVKVTGAKQPKPAATRARRDD
jgi:CheY-like chemotaxis protein